MSDFSVPSPVAATPRVLGDEPLGAGAVAARECAYGLSGSGFLVGGYEAACARLAERFDLSRASVHRILLMVGSAIRGDVAPQHVMRDILNGGFVDEKWVADDLVDEVCEHLGRPGWFERAGARDCSPVAGRGGQ